MNRVKVVTDYILPFTTKELSYKARQKMLVELFPFKQVAKKAFEDYVRSAQRMIDILLRQLVAAKDTMEKVKGFSNVVNGMTEIFEGKPIGIHNAHGNNKIVRMLPPSVDHGTVTIDQFHGLLYITYCPGAAEFSQGKETLEYVVSIDNMEEVLKVAKQTAIHGPTGPFWRPKNFAMDSVGRAKKRSDMRKTVNG